MILPLEARNRIISKLCMVFPYRRLLTLDSVAGVAYDTVLFSEDPSSLASTDLVYLPDGDMKFKTGDELKVTFTNTDTKTYGLSIYYQLI